MERRLAALEAHYALPTDEERADMVMNAWIRDLEMDDLTILAGIEDRQLAGETLDQIRQTLEPEILIRLEELDDDLARFEEAYGDSNSEDYGSK